MRRWFWGQRASAPATEVLLGVPRSTARSAGLSGVVSSGRESLYRTFRLALSFFLQGKRANR